MSLNLDMPHTPRTCGAAPSACEAPMTFDLIIRNVRLDEAGQSLTSPLLMAGSLRSIRLYQAKRMKRSMPAAVLPRGLCRRPYPSRQGLHYRSLRQSAKAPLAEAIRETSKAKAGFTEADVYERASRVVEKPSSWHDADASFVEIDPREASVLRAIKRVRTDYSFAIDIEICAFAQDGLTNETNTFAMLDGALAEGAILVGGCPYTDPDPRRISNSSST